MELQSFIKIVLVLYLILFFSCNKDNKEKLLVTDVFTVNDTCNISFYDGKKVRLYQDINSIKKKIAIYKVLEVYPNPDSLFMTKIEYTKSKNSDMVSQKNFIFKENILHKVIIRVSSNYSDKSLEKDTNKKKFSFLNAYSDSLQKLNTKQKCFKRTVLDSSKFNKTIQFVWE
jgi:hypothetical protein